MIMIIGLVTIGALVWVLASCRARESDAEKRRMTAPSRHNFPLVHAVDGEKNRQVA